MKKARFYMTLVAALAISMTMSAQYTQTDRIAHDVLSGLNSVLQSQERKQQAELFSREKTQFKPVFDETMEEAHASWRRTANLPRPWPSMRKLLN